jgi:hypothetical protein
VKNGVRFFLLALAIMLTVGVAPAVGSGDQTQIILPNGDGFTFETLDGTVTGSVGRTTRVGASRPAA